MFSVVGELSVDFVGQDHQVLLFRKLSNPLQFFSFGNATGRVRREVQEDRLNAWFPSSNQAIGIDGEIIISARSNRNGSGVAKLHAWAIAHVAWLVVDNGFARIQNRR